MINKLKKIENTILKDRLKSIKNWHSLDINYHKPYVERLYTQIGDYRLMLHKIYPCTTKEALYHPHSWKSAIHILKGRQEMGLGYKRPFIYELTETEQIAKIILIKGNYYEMCHPNGYHYVKPLNKPSYSIMLTGKHIWFNPHERKLIKTKLKALDDTTKKELFEEFKELLKI